MGNEICAFYNMYINEISLSRSLSLGRALSLSRAPVNIEDPTSHSCSIVRFHVFTLRQLGERLATLPPEVSCEMGGSAWGVSRGGGACMAPPLPPLVRKVVPTPDVT